jgi:vacuolar-type H+-ATPase subunit I/STV1
MIDALSIGSAAVLTGYLVSLYKLSWPHGPRALLVLVALTSGIASSALLAVWQDGLASVLTDQAIAGIIVQGIVATAAAAGLTRTEHSAEREQGRTPSLPMHSPGTARLIPPVTMDTRS